MKIIVLHGDNSAKVYERLQRFVDVAKERGMRIERLDKNSNVVDSLSAQNLFSEKSLFVISDISILDKKVLTWIKKEAGYLDTTLVIAHGGNLRKSLIDSLPPDTKIEEYK